MRNFFKAIADFLSSVFGGETPETTRPTPTPPPVRDDTDERMVPQDGAEVRPDTVVTIIDETKNEVIEGPAPDLTTDPEVPEPPIPDDPEREVTQPTSTKDNDTDTDAPVPIVPSDDKEPPRTDKDPDPEGPVVVVPPAPRQRYTWILDNGHGKLTAGKRSPIFDDGETQFFEYEFNRDVVERIKVLLDAAGVRYHDLVPDYLSVGNILQERVARANALQSTLPKRYLSVHSNAAPAPAGRWAAASISGIETWHYHTSATGKKLAGIFQRHLVDTMGWKNRHLKSRPDRQFYVLRKTSMPAVLTENGFYNNKEQAKQLMRPEVRQQIAQAHVDAILEIEGRVLA